MKSLHCLVAVFVAAGCSPAWRTLEDSYLRAADGYQVKAPGWKHYPDPDQILLTREGPLLQQILIQRTSLDSGFTFTQRKIEDHHILLEVSEIAVDEIRSAPFITGFMLLENTPAQVAGREGFRLFFKYRTHDGDEYKGMLYGFRANRYLYEISYVAPDLYYFGKDSLSFEQVAESFSLITE